MYYVLSKTLEYDYDDNILSYKIYRTSAFEDTGNGWSLEAVTVDKEKAELIATKKNLESLKYCKENIEFAKKQVHNYTESFVNAQNAFDYVLACLTGDE